MSDQGEGTIKNLGIFSTLQAATDIKFFLLSASFALLIDNAFLILKKPGLIELASSKEALATSNLALQAILIFVAFSFLTSLILPVAAAIVDELYINTAGSWITRLSLHMDKLLGIESRPRPRQRGYVRPGELREEAHQTKEKYYLDLYKEYESEWDSKREHMLKFAMYSFYCFVMLAINFHLGSTQRISAASAIAAYFGNTLPIWIALAVLLFMMFWRFYDRSDPNWIYCPSLYNKLEKNKNP